MTYTANFRGGPQEGAALEVDRARQEMLFPKVGKVSILTSYEDPGLNPVPVDVHVYKLGQPFPDSLGGEVWYDYAGVRVEEKVKEDRNDELPKWAPGLYYVDYGEDPDNPTFHYLSSPLWEGQLEDELQLEVLYAHLQYATRKVTKARMGGSSNG